MKSNDKAQKPPMELGGPLVLVVDDSADIRNVLRVILGGICQVVCANDVEQAIALTRKHNPCLIITDYEMPGRDGLDGVREIRDENPDINIIMLSGSATQDVIDQALREGVKTFLPKPFRAEDIRKCVKHYIDLAYPSFNPIETVHTSWTACIA